jgi:hypothetical protein
MSSDEITDSRFGDQGRNFSSMPLLAPSLARVCPPRLTSWGMPRADLLGGGLEN